MLIAFWTDINETDSLSHFRQKTIFTIFVNGTSASKIVITLEPILSSKMDSAGNNILIIRVLFLERRQKGKIKVI
jgi:hypothetical protein